jgi:hypothetical protein
MALRKKRTCAEWRVAREKTSAPDTLARPPSIISRRPGKGRIVTIVIASPHPAHHPDRRPQLGMRHPPHARFDEMESPRGS